MENESTTSLSALFSVRHIVFAVAAVIVLAGGFGYYFFTSGTSPQDSQAAAKQEAEGLVATVGKLMILPSGELPIIATVADPEKLQDQPFFAKAKKGDKVLIYNTAKKAVLYDPENNLIVDVAPLSIGNQPSPTPSQ